MIRKWGPTDPEPNVVWIGRPGLVHCRNGRWVRVGDYRRVPCWRGRGQHPWMFFGECRRSALREIRTTGRRWRFGKTMWTRARMCQPRAMLPEWAHPHWWDGDKARPWPQVLNRTGSPAWDMAAVRARNVRYRAKVRRSKWR